MNIMQQRAISHYRMLGPKWKPVRMAELASGVIAIEDVQHEIDVFFDLDHWEWVNPDLWTRDPDAHIPDFVTVHNMEVFEGVSCFPPPTTIDAMCALAKKQLRPKGDARWHDRPQILEIE